MGVQIFRALLLLLWAVLAYITGVAVQNYGVAVSGDVFAGDMLAGDWRSQFTTDLIAHIILVGSWIAWRHRFSPLGLVLALLTLMGGLYSLIYVLALSFYHRGDIRAVVLGRQLNT